MKEPGDGIAGRAGGGARPALLLCRLCTSGKARAVTSLRADVWRRTGPSCTWVMGHVAQLVHVRRARY